MKREVASSRCETPLMEKTPSNLAPQEHPSTIKPCDSIPQTPPADKQRVAFNIGGSEEADLDSNMDTKDLDISNSINDRMGPMTITDPHSGQAHTVQKDSGLYKDLLHKLHLAKVGDCIDDDDGRPIRRNNSYTSYTLTIYGIHGDRRYKGGS